MGETVIAKYIRLSVDDAVTESLSIANQRLLLDSFIHDLEPPGAKVLEFVDNGYSGTNFERPAVQELLELVRSGAVHALVTKDFTRFGRNAIETGYFIEQVFPLFGVRVISLDDNYDSNDYKDDTGGIDVAFKFLMGEYYSQDLSMKIKSAKRVRMMRGENIVANAVYGYRKNNCGKWEPDFGRIGEQRESAASPEPAKVVRSIFQKWLSKHLITPNNSIIHTVNNCAQKPTRARSAVESITELIQIPLKMQGIQAMKSSAYQCFGVGDDNMYPMQVFRLVFRIVLLLYQSIAVFGKAGVNR